MDVLRLELVMSATGIARQESPLPANDNHTGCFFFMSDSFVSCMIHPK